MAVELHKKGVLAQLEPRREPYWGPPIEKGRYLGYRKLKNGGTWIARLRDENGKQHYQSLGVMEYRQARAEAVDWFRKFDLGITGNFTVEDACREYVEDLQLQGRLETAHQTYKRFDRYVYGTPFGRTPLSKLRANAIKRWRAETVGGTRANENRYMTALRRALNLAVENRRVEASVAIEWQSVKQHQNADGRREVYLDLKQRRAWAEACEGPIRDLVTAACLTGARPGELVKLKVKDFNSKLSTITFSGKTGKRTVPCSPQAHAFFAKLARGRLPNAPLLDRGDGRHFDRWFTPVRVAAAKAGLPNGVTLYCARHAFITDAIRGGMSPLDVAKITGTSLSMIQAHYGHLLSDAVRERLAEVEMV